MLFEQCGTHYINYNRSNCSTSSFFDETNASNTSDGDGGEVRVQSRTLSSIAGGFPIQLVIELYVIGLLIVVGVVGNVISVVVLRKDKERKDVLFLLQALAVADALYLVAAAFRYPIKYILPGEERFVELQPTVFPLLKTFQTVTIWMMLAVTVDRYTCVCRPLDAPRLFNPTRRRRCAVAVFVFGFLYNAPRFVDSCVVRWYDYCTHTVFVRMLYREAFANRYYYDVYVDGMYTVLLYVGPLSTLVYMNVRLIQAIR